MDRSLSDPARRKIRVRSVSPGNNQPVRTRQANKGPEPTAGTPQDHDEMIADIAVCEAARKSRELGRRAALKEAWHR